ncbi:O-fucosyltransferase 36-like [Aristolochia californica]|uniref:O-fucosyltransferase 36-like n=1 Tax=Aristolochia californica TaxID=171875 RepID=UPI0035D9E0A7
MERESSDEEEDLETLVEQNDTKNRRSTFEIGEFNDRIRRKLGGLGFRKWFLIAISLPLFLIVIFFSVDISSLFRGFTSAKVNSHSPSERMREAELHALYLLRNQHLGLLELWNRTSSNSVLNMNSSSNSTANGTRAQSTVSTVLIDEVRSALLNQIRLNKEIQQSLLSAHRVGNVSDLVDGTLGQPAFGVNTCRKVDKLVGRRTIEWKPKPDRYLFAICLSGQMSNHLICLEKHMFFAALLNRVLVFPSHRFDYQYDRVIDISHINDCVGRKVVISFEEFSEIKKNHLHINKFICYVAEPLCYLDEEHIKRLKSLGLSMGKIEAAWKGDGRPDRPKKRKFEDVMSKFSCEDEVLAIGDMFYASVEEEWVMQPGGPLAHKCTALIQPSRLIVLTAQRFIQTFLGGNFIALHFRRHGFLKFCNNKEESCFFPIPQAADCILRVVERANAPIIYLSTDAAESETNLLQSLVVMNGKMIPLFKRPEHTSVEKWDVLLYRNHIGGDDQVDAMLDKTICAMSNVFIGASGSTFTEDIHRLRKDWGYASVCDEYLCSSEQPNFIADKE